MFGNLWNKTKSAVKKGAAGVVNTLADTGRNAALVLQGNKIASGAPNGLNFNNPVNNALQQGRNTNQTLVPNQTIAPNLATGERGGAGTGGVSQNNVFFQQGKQQAVAESSVRPSTYTPTNGSSAVSAGGASGSWQPTVSASGQVATAQSGIPFFDKEGNYVVPKTGWSGITGMGGSGYSTANSTPATTGMQGLSGTDYARGFAGKGAGTMSATAGQPASDEEARKKKEQGGSVAINPTQQAVNAMTAQGVQNPIQAPSVPDTIDAGWLSQVQESINSTKSSGIPEQDKQTIYAQLQTNLMNAKMKLDQANPIPENPVEDTQEQLEFIQQSEDPFGVKNMVDQFRAEQTNLGQLQTQRVELQKNISALNSAYQPIFKEIKDNPNLPKALARRKIESLAVSQKEVLQGFLDQMDIVKQQISDQNEMVNRQFQIMTFATNQQDKAQDNQRQNLQLFISSGAVAGIVDGELNSYAQRFGVTPKSLKSMKEAQLGKQEIITQEFADGSLKGVDKKTGKVIWSTSGAGKVTGDNTFGTETVNGQRVRYTYDAAGNVVGQTVLGSAGESSAADKKSLFLEYLSSISGTMSKKALQAEAIKAGVGTTDKDIDAAIGKTSKKWWK